MPNESTGSFLRHVIVGKNLIDFVVYFLCQFSAGMDGLALCGMIHYCKDGLRKVCKESFILL